MLRFGRALSLLIGIAPLVGCGLLTPELHDFYNFTPEEGQENIIVNHIKCELHRAVQNALYDPRFFPANLGTGNDISWIRSWGAEVTFDLTVQETTNLNPGVTITDPASNAVLKFFSGNVTVPRSFSLGIGSQDTADATHKETITFTYAFDKLLSEGTITNCANQNGIQIDSDLKIDKFISNKLFVARVPGSIEKNTKGEVFSAFSYDVMFNLTYNLSVAPTWKFTRITVNPTSGLFSTTRKRTQHVLITLAPVQKPSQPATAAAPAVAAELNPAGQLLHNAQVIGNAVATAIQNLSPP